MLENFYDNGRFLRVWSLDEEGRPVCVVDALEVADTEQAVIDATLAENARISILIFGEPTVLPEVPVEGETETQPVDEEDI